MILPACHEVTIAGSVRRGCPQVHDVDLVVWPKYTNAAPAGLFDDQVDADLQPVELLERLEALGVKASPEARIIRFIWAEIPVELYLCEPDGSNYGALLQMRTGSRQFNVFLAQRAQMLHLRYKAGYGLFDDEGKRVDDGSERGIFDALKLKFVLPQDRK